MQQYHWKPIHTPREEFPRLFRWLGQSDFNHSFEVSLGFLHDPPLLRTSFTSFLPLRASSTEKEAKSARTSKKGRRRPSASLETSFVLNMLRIIVLFLRTVNVTAVHMNCEPCQTAQSNLYLVGPSHPSEIYWSTLLLEYCLRQKFSTPARTLKISRTTRNATELVP